MSVNLSSRTRLWAWRGALLAGTKILDYGGRFLRTFLLARMLAPEEVGVALAISAVVSSIELMADPGFDKFVMRFTGGEAARAMAAMHALLVLRSVLVFVVLYSLSWTFAGLFGVPEAVLSFQIAAAFVLVRGLTHTSMFQRQRDYAFGTLAKVILVSQPAGMLGLLLGLWWFGDHRAVLVSYACDSAAYVVMSHLLAAGRWSMRADREMARAAMLYALPLMVNGAGLAALQQGDRMLVGAELGVTALALYGLLITLTLVPVSALFRTFATVALAMMARAGEDVARRRSSMEFLAWMFGAVALGYALGLALLLDLAMVLLFGERYAVPAGLHLLATLLGFLRVQRGLPTVQLLNDGRTGRVAAANLTALGGLVLAWALLQAWPSLEALLIGLILADLIGLFLLLRWAGEALPEATAVLSAANRVAMLGTGLVLGALWLLPAPGLTERGMIALVGVAGLSAMALAAWRAWRRREAGHA